MTDFHVEVVRLGKIEKHPNADALDITFVHGGYPCIVKKDSFKEGDLAVYIPVEVTLPDRPEFSFLSANERRRLKAKKLRGFFSMGLVIPVPADVPAVEGTDVAELMGITKFEPYTAPPRVLGGDCEPDPDHFTFHRYTDIEPLRRNGSVLQDGEEVILTEKLHGCFKPKTSITMADGSKKSICDIQIGEFVAGVDENGLIVPSRVLNTWVNSTDSWISVKATRKKVNQGNHFSKFVCTPNHQVATGSASSIIWKNAEELVEGDKLLMHRHGLTVPELQRQILLGILLGDGSLTRKEGSECAYITWGHKAADHGYMQWIERGLGDLFHKSKAKREYTSGFGSSMFRDRTVARGHIWKTFRDFIDPKTGNKTVPSWLPDQLTPLAIAFWFMDDGSVGNPSGEDQDSTASFATCGFSIEDCGKLCKAFNRFGIEASVTTYMDRGKSRNRLALNSVNAEKLFLLIAPYVPACMSRKLPLRYRGGEGWLPPPQACQRYSQIVLQDFIKSELTQLHKSVKSYDLTTETHNFFAHELLVHNSNYRAVHDGNRLWIGSRQQIKKRPEDLKDGAVWWRIAREYDLESRLSKFPFLTFFGEVFGPGVQDLTYGQANQSLRIFDVQDVRTGEYVDHDTMVKLVNDVGLELVPHLYRGPWDPSKLLDLCEGKTTLGNVHCREGFVVKPTTERWDHRVGRVILKMVGESYHTRKEK